MEPELVPQTSGAGGPQIEVSPRTPAGLQSGLGDMSRYGISGGLPPGFSPKFSEGLPRVPLWLRVIPFFLSALIFVSAFLALFSPLPILVSGLSRSSSPRLWTFFVCLTNSLIVFILGGPASLVTYLVFCVVPSLTLLELIFRRQSLERTALAALMSMAIAGAGAVLSYAHFYHAHPVAEARTAVSQFVDYVAKASSENGGANHLPVQAAQDPADIEDWKQNLMVELPSAVAVMALIMVWANLITLLRMNPANIRARLGLRPDFFQVWKAPEWLIWPTIAAGLTLLVNFGAVSEVGRNVFKFLMAIYALQGLSVLSAAFLRWKVKKFLRVLGYGVAVLVMMPLLLSLGFFDLWFDFRAKFRQS